MVRISAVHSTIGSQSAFFLSFLFCLKCRFVLEIYQKNSLENNDDLLCDFFENCFGK